MSESVLLMGAFIAVVWVCINVTFQLADAARTDEDDK